MRPFFRLLGALPAAAIAACAADDSVGPSAAFDLVPRVGAEASSANSGNDVPGSKKVYCVNETSCFAVAYEFRDQRDDPLPGRNTVFSVYVQNLQGTYPSDGPSIPLSLRLFRFRFFETQESSNYVDAYAIETFSSVGNVQEGVATSWNNDGPSAGVNFDTFFAIGGAGIMGCDVDPVLLALRWFTFRTCPREGLDGWVRVDFILRRVGIEASNAPVRLHDFAFSFGTLAPAQLCTIGGPQPETCTVLPYKKAVSP